MNRSALALVSLLAILLFPISLWAQDGWTPTTLTGAPEARTRHTAVWTGQEMIVWGGDAWIPGPLNSGGKYDPATDIWAATSLAGAPAARNQHTAIWTGNEMIVWGGHDSSNHLNTGGRYDPQLDTWTFTTPSGAPSGRTHHTAVWTGQVMIVWGGYEAMDSGLSGVVASNTTNTGGRYDPVTNSWISISTVGAPSARFGHTAIWTGTEMIVWGGVDGTAIPTSNGVSYANNALRTGARYDPETDTWTPMTSVGCPPATDLHTAVWTGAEMLVWGGTTPTGADIPGGRYWPELDSWTLLPTLDAPNARYGHTAVWTGQEMIVWGGATSTYEARGAKYSVETNSWVATSLDDAPSGRLQHTAVWTGSRMIVWGGTEGGNTDTGSIYGGDATPPVPGSVGDGPEGDLDSQGDLESISANWTGFDDPESGISHYDWAIGTSPGATDVMSFTDVGSATAATATGLLLETGVTYYATVRATNGDGKSITVTSNGVSVGGKFNAARGCSAAAAHSASPLAALSIIVLLASCALRKRT